MVDLDPSTADAAIILDNVHVRYRTMIEEARDVRGVLRNRLRARAVGEVHALKGISARIDVGEAVGVIGNNGSGKSTLLSAIAGLTPIGDGSHIYVRGSATLLGVGAVLKRQLSGARNIYIGGLALGLSRAEIDARFDDIVADTRLGDAINRPVQTYSSGMKSRLQFAIATAVRPEILLIDEVLAVGDRRFRRRGLRRIGQVKQNAGTIVMVTHRFKEIRATCDRTIWLHDGELRADGTTDEVLTAYEEASDSEED